MSKVDEHQTYHTMNVCSQVLDKFELHGFPSGHAASAFAGWTFLVLYLNGKSKPWNGGAYFWKVILLILPLLLASWVSITRLRDFNHFPFQIITGGIIGIVSALIAYRLNYVVNGWFLGPGDRMDHVPVHYYNVQQQRQNSNEMEQIVVVPRHEHDEGHEVDDQDGESST
jgi:diacylglycerol diphosphate phosphatase/phosphatidate phosphatase